MGLRRVVVPVAVLLLAAACGSTVPPEARRAAGEASGVDGPSAAPGDDAGDTTGETVAGPGDAGVTGAAASPRGSGGTRATNGLSPVTVPGDAPVNTTPLKVGLAYNDNSGTEAALGVSNPSTVNGKTAAQALVRGVNATGGLRGRQLRAVEYSWNTQDTNYNADATVACERFTKDERVEVVIDAAFGRVGGFGDCIQKAGVLQITNGVEGDRATSQRGPLHANTRSMVDDRTYAAVVTNLVATRYLTKTNQLGVFIERCPTMEAAYQRTVKPLIAKLGLKAPVEASIECTTGFGSAGPAASAVSSAILAFRQAQVDKVMMMHDFEAVLLLLFGNSASSQQYRPGYALSSTAQAEFVRTQIPEDQWPGLNGVGSVPTGDVTDTGAAPTGVEARCIQLARAGGLQLSVSTDKVFVYGACSLFLLLEAALARTRGNSNPPTLQTAINSLGTSFAAPDLAGNSTRYTSTDHDGPNAVQVFAYNAACTCIRYTSGPLPAPQ